METVPRTPVVSPDQFATFGELLRHLRRRAGLTQRELAIAVGYSDTQLSHMEQNDRVPDQATITARLIPGLQLDDEPQWAARLLALARIARGLEPTVPLADFSAPPLTKHNLPLQLTSFIGREREMAGLQGLLHLNRLITLTGAGGSGKTRLALETAHKILTEFPDGVWFIELASLSDPALVPWAALTTLGLHDETGRETSLVLVEYLRPKTALLIFDNCEQVVQGCASLAETLLRACPWLHVLAASREALGVPGEVTFPVPALSLPDQHASLSPALDALAAYEAVRLFVERAQYALSSFRLTNANAAAIIEICRRLDGIPLAIELAAARVRTLQVQQIADRLVERFRLLTSGSRTALPRHQTLLACIDWSYALLPEMEQTLWRRLSVFAGGCTLEAAEVVGGDDSLENGTVLEGLAQLANKSIVNVEREEAHTPRYRLLETIRQYGLDKMLEASEGEDSRDRHLGYFLELAARAESELTGPRQVAWLNQLETELDNIRAALGWSLERDTDAGMRLASALVKFWEARGYNSEGADWLARLLHQPAALRPSAARAKALSAQAFLVTMLGDFTLARSLAEESLELCRERGDQRGLAFSAFVLGRAMHWQGENKPAGRALFAQSLAQYRDMRNKLGISEVLGVWASFDLSEDPVWTRASLEESLALCRELGHVAGIGDRLANLGILALYQGDHESARLHLEESLSIQRQLGERGALFGLYRLGEWAYSKGDYAQARAYYEECLALSNENRLHTVGLWACVQLGHVALRQGQTALARTHFKQAWALLAKDGIKTTSVLLWALDGWASLARAEGQPERAVRLFEWTSAMRAVLGERPYPLARLDLEHDWALLRSRLDEETIAEASRAGRAMNLDQAVALAVSEADS